MTESVSRVSTYGGVMTERMSNTIRDSKDRATAMRWEVDKESHDVSSDDGGMWNVSDDDGEVEASMKDGISQVTDGWWNRSNES